MCKSHDSNCTVAGRIHILSWWYFCRSKMDLNRVMCIFSSRVTSGLYIFMYLTKCQQVFDNCWTIRTIFHDDISTLPSGPSACRTAMGISQRNELTGLLLGSSSYIIMWSRSWQYKSLLRKKMGRKSGNGINVNFQIWLVFCFFQVSLWKIWNAQHLAEWPHCYKNHL